MKRKESSILQMVLLTEIEQNCACWESIQYLKDSVKRYWSRVTIIWRLYCRNKPGSVQATWCVETLFVLFPHPPETALSIVEWCEVFWTTSQCTTKECIVIIQILLEHACTSPSHSVFIFYLFFLSLFSFNDYFGSFYLYFLFFPISSHKISLHLSGSI